MSRKAHATSRRPILSETEAALQWELRRTQKDLQILRKATRETVKDTPLTPDGIAVLVRKIGTMVRNCLPGYYRDADPCPHCGGRTIAQIEDAFETWAEAEANPVNRYYDTPLHGGSSPDE